jgi:twitching motility protein PilT
MAQIDEILKLAQERGASDLHLSPGSPPMARLNGEVLPLADERLARDALQLMLFEIADAAARARFEQTREADFAYELPGVARARCSLYEQSRGVAGALRLLPPAIPSCEDLGLPQRAVDLVQRPLGLVVISGPPGSGRSCTLAALVDHVNQKQCRHVVTLEAPIEFRHACRNSLVDQREIGHHTPSLAQGLRAALHADADLIVACEPRDPEALELALEAAAGRLVLLTWTATSAARTVSGMLAGLAGDRRARAAALLAESLAGVLCHRLLPRADRPGRVLALEVLAGTPAVANLIREQHTAQIDALLRNGTPDGMQSMEDAVRALVRAGMVTEKNAAAHLSAEEGSPSSTAGAESVLPQARPQHDGLRKAA